MKLIINVIIFLIVLTIPFALSSQIRKAIPSGRFEALSGIKVSHTKADGSNLPNNQNVFWFEVGKSISNDITEVSFVNETKLNLNLKSLIQNKSFKAIKKADQVVDLVITDDLKKEKKFKNINNKSLIVFITSQPLSDVANMITNYSLILSQANNNENYYLLKLK